MLYLQNNKTFLYKNTWFFLVRAEILISVERENLISDDIFHREFLFIWNFIKIFSQIEKKHCQYWIKKLLLIQAFYQKL